MNLLFVINRNARTVSFTALDLVGARACVTYTSNDSVRVFGSHRPTSADCLLYKL